MLRARYVSNALAAQAPPRASKILRILKFNQFKNLAARKLKIPKLYKILKPPTL